MTVFEEALRAAEAAGGDLRAALRAAAPVLMAEAWDEGAEAVVDEDNPPRARNPYYT